MPLSDDVHCLISRDCVQCSAHGSEPLAGDDPLLHETVILFDSVIDVTRSPTLAATAESAGSLQLIHRTGVRRVAIHVDHPRTNPPSAPQRELEKGFGRDTIPLR